MIFQCMHVYFPTYSQCLSILYFNDVIKNVFFSHHSYHDETAYNLNDDGGYLCFNELHVMAVSVLFYLFFLSDFPYGCNISDHIIQF